MTAFAHYPSLTDRTVLITGGATGIGATLVEQFAAQGARVGFIDIDTAGAALAERLAGARHAPLFVAADLRRRLRLKARGLILGIVELGETVRELAAADGDIEISEDGRQESRQLGNWHRQIGVADESIRFGRGEEARLDRAALATVRLALQDDARIGAGVFLYDVRRAVGRTIVDDPDFPAPGPGAEKRRELGKRLGKARLFIECRNDNRDPDGRIVHRYCVASGASFGAQPA